MRLGGSSQQFLDDTRFGTYLRDAAPPFSDASVLLLSRNELHGDGYKIDPIRSAASFEVITG